MVMILKQALRLCRLENDSPTASGDADQLPARHCKNTSKTRTPGDGGSGGKMNPFSIFKQGFFLNGGRQPLDNFPQTLTL